MGRSIDRVAGRWVGKYVSKKETIEQFGSHNYGKRTQLGRILNPRLRIVVNKSSQCVGGGGGGGLCQY